MLGALVLIGTVNGLVLLPVLLSIVGPPAEVSAHVYCLLLRVGDPVATHPIRCTFQDPGSGNIRLNDASSPILQNLMESTIALFRSEYTSSIRSDAIPGPGRGQHSFERRF